MREWVISHISDNPDISFGSLYRDVCLCSNRFYLEPGSRIHDEIFKYVRLLKEESLIVEIEHSNNRFYRLNKQLSRDKGIMKILS